MSKIFVFTTPQCSPLRFGTVVKDHTRSHHITEKLPLPEAISKVPARSRHCRSLWTCPTKFIVWVRAAIGGDAVVTTTPLQRGCFTTRHTKAHGFQPVDGSRPSLPRCSPEEGFVLIIEHYTAAGNPVRCACHQRTANRTFTLHTVVRPSSTPMGAVLFHKTKLAKKPLPPIPAARPPWSLPLAASLVAALSHHRIGYNGATAWR